MTPDVATAIDEAAVIDLYATMRLVRRVEEEIVRIYPTDAIRSPVHLSIGQEASAVGVCRQMRDDDVLFSTYRGHATYLAKGGDLDAMWAELYGRVDGCARGKAGSMHLVDTDANVMGTSAIVATGIPNAVGYALALRMQRRDQVVVCFFGEGATDEGVFHESLNFAAVQRLPIVFVCEHNGYAVYSPTVRRMAGRLRDRVGSYGITHHAIDDGDVLAVYRAAGRALADARDGAGPQLVEIATTRWHEHVGPGHDLQVGDRAQEIRRAQDDDQLARLAGMVPHGTVARIDADVEQVIRDAIAFAEASGHPSLEELHANVYAS